MTLVDPSLKPQTPVPAAQPARAGDVRIANPDGKRELIMVVDDDDYVTMLAERILTAEDYRVVTGREGFQALESYKKLASQVDLVILDLVMPVMDGAMFFREIRRINPQAAVVLTSGFDLPDKLKWLIDNGLRGFIPKPFTHKKLSLQVRATLDIAQSESGK